VRSFPSSYGTLGISVVARESPHGDDLVAAAHPAPSPRFLDLPDPVAANTQGILVDEPNDMDAIEGNRGILRVLTTQLPVRGTRIGAHDAYLMPAAVFAEPMSRTISMVPPNSAVKMLGTLADLKGRRAGRLGLGHPINAD
jgi:hypothetical protein